MRQTALLLAVFQYTMRLELSTPFRLLFRLTTGRVIGVPRREFAVPHHLMIAGAGERAPRLASASEDSGEYDVWLRGFLSGQAGPPPKMPWVRYTGSGGIA